MGVGGEAWGGGVWGWFWENSLVHIEFQRNIGYDYVRYRN